MITGAPIAGGRSRPWERRSIKKPTGDNAARNRAALAAMDECQQRTGLTVDQIDQLHAEQRARVRERYGLAA